MPDCEDDDMKVVSVEQLSSVLSDLPKNPRVIASGNVATPTVLLGVLDRQVETFRLHMLNAQHGIPDRDGVTYETTFIGPGMRGSERLQYVPCRLSLVPVLYRDHYRPDVVLLHASARHHDTVSLGLETNVMPAAIEAAREHGGLVIAQANPQMPYTYGDAQIYENDIDYLVEVDEPIPTPGGSEISDASRRIGELVAAQISSGSTMQMGIGAVPDAVLSSMTEVTHMSVWTEMFSDGVLTLEKRGQLDPDVPVTASFAMGSRELYDWMDGNRRVRMLRTESTNNPGNISRQRQMTSVNAAMQVDLFDQANASRVKGRIYSGFGGSTDFIVGALHSRGGQSFIALPSWHPKAHVSTIVPLITEPVTSFQHTYVATEQGLARTFGLSQTDQATNIIEKAAHPDARDALREAAVGFGLLK